MSSLQETSASLPEYAKDMLTESEKSTYQKHVVFKEKYLQDASKKHPYSVFSPEFGGVSATAELAGISAASQDNANYPGGVRRDLLIQYTKPIVGSVFDSPSPESEQQGDILRIKDRGDRVPHKFPAKEDDIKPYETLEKLWPRD